MRPGRRLGVDVGSVRVGVAVSDPDGRLAVPLGTVLRGPGDLAALVTLAAQHTVIEVVVGLPLTLAGEHGPAAQTAAQFGSDLADALAASSEAGPVPVRLVDERLSTTAAHRELTAAGMGGRRRRSVVDRSAAAMILQTALDTERQTGHPAGDDAHNRPVPPARPGRPRRPRRPRRPEQGEV